MMFFGIPAGVAPEPVGPQVRTFDFKSHPFRAVVRFKDEPVFVLADAARRLGYRDAEKAGRLVRDKHKGTLPKGIPDLQEGMTYVTEAGLYRLMMRSNHPEAEEFQDWIAEDVLPSIRKTGAYALPAGRAGRECVRLKCDPATGALRAESFTVNKGTHKQLAMDGACPNQFVYLHDGGYVVLSGMKTAELRNELGLTRHQTPQDRFTASTLAMKYLPLEILGKATQDAAEPIPVAEQIEMAHRFTRELRDKILDLHGAGSVVGVRPDKDRGKVLDVIRAPQPLPQV